METVNLKGNYSVLKQFIDKTRKLNHSNVDLFNELFVNQWHEHSNELKVELNELVNELFDNAFFVNAFAEYGINSNNGFSSEIITKIKHKILPLSLPKEELSHYIQYLFNDAQDYLWLNKINLNNWKMILGCIDNIDLGVQLKIQLQIGNSLTILCNRLTNLGIDRS